MPSAIEQVHQDYKERGLTVLPISIEEGRGKVATWLGKHQPVTTTFLLDPDGVVSAAYRITATPTVYLVGRDGKLIAKAVGTKEWTSDKGRALFRLLLKK